MGFERKNGASTRDLTDTKNKRKSIANANPVDHVVQNMVQKLQVLEVSYVIQEEIRYD